VIIRHCDTYDPERIRTIIREGLQELDLRPHGRTLVKPNIVASGPLFEHAYTRPEFAEGVLRALRDRATDDLSELAIGERCGITIPTRLAFEGAGYASMIKRVGVKRYCFEEEPQVEIALTHKERLRDYLFTPEPVARADFFVNIPKFKAHPWTTVTFSMKNYIGIQDDRHRLIDHDHRLSDKVADLQYIVQPSFIAIDAIVAGEGRMLTPIPFPLNLIVMGDNQVAFDATCCRIIGIDPMTVDHIRLAHERGFGPIEAEKIRFSGDVTFDQARERATGFRSGLIRVEPYFEGTRISAYAGPPPEPERTDYCWGGCPGAIEEAIEILRLFDKDTDAKMPRLHVVFGSYRGPIPAAPGEKVIFVGDCANWQGELGANAAGHGGHGAIVQIQSVYKDRSQKDPHFAQHEDIFAKMLKMAQKLRENDGEQVIRFEGCPVSVAEQVLFLVHFGKLKNPYFDTSQMYQFNKAYLQWRSTVALRRAMGKPYQRNGPTERGKAKPELA
jgi:uncharacterized protein (DUF362 family)